MNHKTRGSDPDSCHTAMVVLASALAAHEINKKAALDRAKVRRLGDTPRVEGRRYEFALLAAAERSAPELPQQAWFDATHALSVRAETSPDGMRLHLQAIGYAALRALAGRAARLSAANGAIDQRFRFDALGRGLLVLGAEREVVEGLRAFSVGIVEEE